MDSCQWSPSNPSKQQETETGIPSEQPWKRKAPTRETGRRGGVAGPSADPLMKVHQGLFPSALLSEPPPGDLRSQRCVVSQDRVIFNRFYEMSIPTARTGHSGSGCTLSPLWAWIFRPSHVAAPLIITLFYCCCDLKWWRMQRNI